MKYNQPRNDGSPSKRKFKGFNFYIQSNDKLSKRNRNTLLNRSNHYLSEVSSSLNLSGDRRISEGIIEELDSTLTDYELLDGWNHMYDEYGYLMSGFKEQWEKEKMGTIPPQTTPSIVQTLLDEIESLKIEMNEIKKLVEEHSNPSSLGF